MYMLGAVNIMKFILLLTLLSLLLVATVHTVFAIYERKDFPFSMYIAVGVVVFIAACIVEYVIKPFWTH